MNTQIKRPLVRHARRLMVGSLICLLAFTAMSLLTLPPGTPLAGLIGQSAQAQGGNPTPPPMTVTPVGSSYRIAPGNLTGNFGTGQPGSVLLNRQSFEDSGGPLSFSYPGGISSDGVRLLMADRGNNRVLIWNTIPNGNVPPDLVLGQKDFRAYDSGTGQDQMNWPVTVRTDGRRVIVADTNNDRLLIWNNFPVTNGQPADLVIRNTDLRWPWGLWTDGNRLAVSSTSNSSVLIWNTFPTADTTPYSIKVTANGQLGTPRTITSNGQSLIVGDHNPRVPGESAGIIGNFVWNTFPTAAGQPADFFYSEPVDSRFGWLQGAFAPDGRLYMISRRLHLWNSMITAASDLPDASSSGSFEGGDGTDLLIANGRLYLSLYNGHRILVYNTLPSSLDQAPDFAIGSPAVNTNPINIGYRLNNPVPATDGRSLWVTSDFDRKMFVWRNIPDDSGARPDFVYNLQAQIWDNTVHGNTLAMAGGSTVYIWNRLPRNGELPDVTISGRIGNIQLQSLRGVAMDDRYFYLSDEQAGKIYVFEGVPTASSSPRYTLDLSRPQRLSVNGSYLTALSEQANAILFYRLNDLQAPPIQLSWPGRFNLPADVLMPNGGLVVADLGFGRVQIWNRLEDALALRSPDILLGTRTISELTQETARDKLHRPATLAFDGSYLWVGEFKFSHRLIRFDLGGLVTNSTLTAVSAATFKVTDLAADSMVAVFGSGLAPAAATANVLPLPTQLGGVTALIRDNAGTDWNAPLFYVSPAQVNLLLPSGLAPGRATLRIGSGLGEINVGLVSPGLFSANASGEGAAVGGVIRVLSNGTQIQEALVRLDSSSGRYVPVPIDIGGSSDVVYLTLYGTGWRNRSSLSGIELTIGGVTAEVSYAGEQGTYAGLDQLNLRLPRTLAGRGEVPISLRVDGKPANLLTVQVK